MAASATPESKLNVSSVVQRVCIYERGSTATSCTFDHTWSNAIPQVVTASAEGMGSLVQSFFQFAGEVDDGQVALIKFCNSTGPVGQQHRRKQSRVGVHFKSPKSGSNAGSSLLGLGKRTASTNTSICVDLVCVNHNDVIVALLVQDVGTDEMLDECRALTRRIHAEWLEKMQRGAAGGTCTDEIVVAVDDESGKVADGEQVEDIVTPNVGPTIVPHGFEDIIMQMMIMHTSVQLV